MVTSRTGSTVYLRNSARVKRQARADGLTHCPGYEDAAGVHHPCGVALDYDFAGQSNSVETDHIVEYRFGGTDAVENLRVLCRRCNLDRNRSHPVPVLAVAEDFPLLRAW